MNTVSTFLELLATNNLLFLCFVGTVSLMVGSFLNVVIYRLPKMMQRDWDCECRELLHDELKHPTEQTTPIFNLMKPDSHCPSCQSPVRAWQNIPILSYVLLKGKCGECKAPISIRYPFVELLTAVSSIVVAIKFGYSAQTLILIPLTWAFISLIFIDIDQMMLPDQITVPFLWLILLSSTQPVFLSPEQTLFGAAAGYLSLWSVFWLFKIVTGKEGMGYGDFKLMAIVGAVVGVFKLPMVILMSSLVGAFIGILMMSVKKMGRDSPMPFGPYIAIAGWLTMLWGEEIFNWYIQFLV